MGALIEFENHEEGKPFFINYGSICQILDGLTIKEGQNDFDFTKLFTKVSARPLLLVKDMTGELRIIPFWLSLIFLLFAVFTRTSVSKSFSYITDIDVPHPNCLQFPSLSLGREFFKPISNPLVGVSDYNQLIELYAKRDWERFDQKVEKFELVYESSPLLEPVAFLKLQSKFERESSDDEKKSIELEKELRKLGILYPKSELLPVLILSTADHYLSRREFQKSLSLFASLRQEFPLHGSKCVVLMGIANSKYGLNDFGGARSTFQLVLNKCHNKSIRRGAQFRLVDLENLTGGSGTVEQYEKLIEQARVPIMRQYPYVYYQIGELKFKKNKYKSAQFYFEKFLKSAHAPDYCKPYALKRLGDIGLFRGAPPSNTKARYLQAREQFPNTDAGRISYIQAMLINLKEVEEGEYQRRLRIIDEQIKDINDSIWREAVLLKKGLALLDTGNHSALDFLSKLDQISGKRLLSKSVMDFIRERYMLLMEKEVKKEANDLSKPRKSIWLTKFISNLEETYPKWIKGSRFAKRAHELYSHLAVLQFLSQSQSGQIDVAIQRFKKLTKNPQWTNTAISDDERRKYSTLIFDKFVQEYTKRHDSRAFDNFVRRSKVVLWSAGSVLKEDRAKLLNQIYLDLGFGKNSEKVAQLLKTKKKVLEELFPFDVDQLLLTIHQTLEDQSSALEALSKVSPIRKPSSVNQGLTANSQSYLNWNLGRSYYQKKDFDKADIYLQKVVSFPYRKRARQLRLKMFVQRKKFQSAFMLAQKMFEAKELEDKRPILASLYEVVGTGKLWNRAPKLIDYAKSLELPEKEVAPYYYLAGKAYYKGNQCERSVTHYERGLELDGESKFAAEAHYYLGKCFLKQNRKTRAKKIWEDLVKLNDEFWSPMGKNELSLIRNTE